MVNKSTMNPIKHSLFVTSTLTQPNTPIFRFSGQSQSHLDRVPPSERTWVLVPCQKHAVRQVQADGEDFFKKAVSVFHEMLHFLLHQIADDPGLLAGLDFDARDQTLFQMLLHALNERERGDRHTDMSLFPETRENMDLSHDLTRVNFPHDFTGVSSFI